MSDQQLRTQHQEVIDRNRAQRLDANAQVERRAQEFNARLAERRAAESGDGDEF
ncbi:hypothetical protein [Actinoplanes sp. ATCC 53533]|uniref:hypothetical protein n=1 Tax=Actinoplanes sp. ATCC 53533 TaxID=1288362 RepID=UPI001315078A|nr:hypothetical protein [Actinoplanes sp. ATCC 53533]